MKPIAISATIITYNEEKNLKRCLQSLKHVADEIIICDGHSTDNTRSIAESFGARFVTHTFEGHIQQKNKAIDLATNKHILSLDADEALSEPLIKAILEIKKNWQADAYSMSRLTNYCGKWIRHGAWYPDRKIRLFDKTKGRWGGTNPHDQVIMQEGAKIHILGFDLLHYSFYTHREFVTRSEKYAHIAADAMHKKGKKVHLLKLLFTGPIRFFIEYFLRQGFRDGFYGFYIARVNGYTNFLKYSYLYWLNKSKF